MSTVGRAYDSRYLHARVTNTLSCKVFPANPAVDYCAGIRVTERSDCPQFRSFIIRIFNIISVYEMANIDFNLFATTLCYIN